MLLDNDDLPLFPMGHRRRPHYGFLIYILLYHIMARAYTVISRLFSLKLTASVITFQGNVRHFSKCLASHFKTMSIAF